MNQPWPTIESSLQALKRNPYQERWDLDSLVQMLQSAGNLLARSIPEDRQELIARFHDCAGRLPYPDDADIGALILEAVGDEATEKGFKKWLYQEAEFRAHWCASSGTSGGECMARAKHLERINAKLQSI